MILLGDSMRYAAVGFAVTLAVFFSGFSAGRAYTVSELNELLHVDGRLAQAEYRLTREERERERLARATSQGFQWVDGVFRSLFGPPPEKQQAGQLGRSDRG